MKLYHLNNLLLYIPINIIKNNRDIIIFNLKRPITFEDKLKLYKIDNIIDIKLKLKQRNVNYNYNLIIIEDYIYNFQLLNNDINNIYKHKTYFIQYNKNLNTNNYTQQILSNQFLQNL